MKVLLYEPGKDPVEKESENQPKALQTIVGGQIETLPVTRELILVCNEDGKRQHLKPNRALYLGREWFDNIHGTFFVCRFRDEDFDGVLPGDREKADRHLIL